MIRAARAGLLGLVAALAGCHQADVPPPAALTIIQLSNTLVPPVLDFVSGVLKPEGFEDYGRAVQSIDLIQQENAPEASKRPRLARLEREYNFLNDAQELNVIITDYSTGVPPQISLPYQPISDRFVQISISSARPGGLGADGRRFHARFLSLLRQQFGSSLVIVREAPVACQFDWERILDWCVSFAFSLLLTGTGSFLLLHRLALSITVKRLIFSVANAWLAAPLELQPGYMFFFPAPNVLAFPWTHARLYAQQLTFALLSFSYALLICLLVSQRLFRRASNLLAG